MIDAQLRGLVDTAWDSYTRLRDADACYLVQPSVPILFFGDLQRYLASPVRVVTVGLNPSRLEFPADDTFSGSLMCRTSKLVVHGRDFTRHM